MLQNFLQKDETHETGELNFFLLFFFYYYFQYKSNLLHVRIQDSRTHKWTNLHHSFSPTTNQRNQDIEELVSKTNGDDSGRKRTRIETILKPEGRLLQWWNMIFAVSCVIAVSVDPLFFYLPIIDRKKQIMSLDKRLRIIVYSLRSVTDMIYLLNIILQFICPYIDEASRKLGRTKVETDPRKIAKRYFLSRYFIIDVLAILPLPQVFIPISYSKIKYSKYLAKRSIVNAVVFFQYVPRVLRIYISWMNLTRPASKLVRIAGVKAAFNFFLYILSSHVLGAFWYLLSIQRETACWHIAYHKNIEPKDHCPVETPNTTRFDFGIFLTVLQSGNLESTNFPRKLVYCFWWGLRNLSSFGQNLLTSTYIWENCFAISVSIIALLLFLYFIGNVQTYMQMKTTKSEEITQNIGSKEVNIQLWISRNQLPGDIKERIISCMQHILEEKKDFDTEKPIPHLPTDLTKEIKHHLCLPLLRKVQILENESENLLRWICESLKPLYYNEDSYILREGEPLNSMVFITQGSVWCFKTSNGENGEGSVSGAQCIEKGGFYGRELLEWGFNGSPTPKLSDLPISKTVKTLTKVEAFALTANDWKILVVRYSQATSQKVSTAKDFRRRLNEKINKTSPKMAKQNNISSHALGASRLAITQR